MLNLPSFDVNSLKSNLLQPARTSTAAANAPWIERRIAPILSIGIPELLTHPSPQRTRLLPFAFPVLLCSVQLARRQHYQSLAVGADEHLPGGFLVQRVLLFLHPVRTVAAQRLGGIA